MNGLEIELDIETADLLDAIARTTDDPFSIAHLLRADPHEFRRFVEHNGLETDANAHQLLRAVEWVKEPPFAIVNLSMAKAGELLASGAMQRLQESSNVHVSISADGAVHLTSGDEQNLRRAEQMLEMMRDTISSEIVVGAELEGVVTKVLPFGAFVRVMSEEGLVHITEVADERIEDLAQVISTGTRVWVKVLDVREGRIKLSMRGVPQALAREASSIRETFELGLAAFRRDPVEP